MEVRIIYGGRPPCDRQLAHILKLSNAHSRKKSHGFGFSAMMTIVARRMRKPRTVAPSSKREYPTEESHAYSRWDSNRPQGPVMADEAGGSRPCMVAHKL
jgi:hypothetical protein